MQVPQSRPQIEAAIDLVVQGLRSLRHEGQFDEPNLDGTAGDYISFDAWEWPQGVGLYGLAQLWLQTGDAGARKTLEDWYARHIERGLPAANINTSAPMLALSLLWRETRDPRWEAVLRDWADNAVAHGVP